MKILQITIGYLTLASFVYLIFWLINFVIQMNLLLVFILILIFVIFVFNIKPGNNVFNPFSFDLSFRQ